VASDRYEGMFHKEEQVNMVTDQSPAHYSRWKIEPVSFIMANKLAYAEGNVIKYVMRHDAKDGVKDIDKAIRYLEMIKENQYGIKSNTKTTGVPLDSNPDSWRSIYKKCVL
jgi:hypothetical protein